MKHQREWRFVAFAGPHQLGQADSDRIPADPWLGATRGPDCVEERPTVPHSSRAGPAKDRETTQSSGSSRDANAQLRVLIERFGQVGEASRSGFLNRVSQVRFLPGARTCASPPSVSDRPVV